MRLPRRLWRQTDVFLTNNDEWATSDLIAENSASYRLGADCGNGTLTLYVDGQQIASVSQIHRIQPALSVYSHGVRKISSAADVTFDDFVMTKL